MFTDGINSIYCINFGHKCIATDFYQSCTVNSRNSNCLCQADTQHYGCNLIHLSSQMERYKLKRWLYSMILHVRDSWFLDPCIRYIVYCLRKIEEIKTIKVYWRMSNNEVMVTLNIRRNDCITNRVVDLKYCEVKSWIIMNMCFFLGFL